MSKIKKKGKWSGFIRLDPIVKKFLPNHNQVLGLLEK